METIDTNQEPKSNSILYTTIVLLIISLGYIIYIYSSYEIIKKDTLEEKYVLKSNIDFNMLSSYEKTNYVDSYKYTNQIANLKKKILQLEGKSKEPHSIKTIEIEKIVKVPIEKIVKVPVEKIVEVEKVIEVERMTNTPLFNEKTKDSHEKRTFATYTCKSMVSGSIQISQKCKDELYTFLEKNRNSKVYEVIGMIDNKDFKLLNKLKDVYGEKKIRHLSKYSQIGLSRQRVIEASWLMKKYLGNYKNIKTVNYTVNAKNKKGFIVRAYN